MSDRMTDLEMLKHLLTVNGDEFSVEQNAEQPWASMEDRVYPFVLTCETVSYHQFAAAFESDGSLAPGSMKSFP